MRTLRTYSLLLIFLYAFAGSNTALSIELSADPYKELSAAPSTNTELSNTVLTNAVGNEVNIAYNQGKGILLFTYSNKNKEQHTNQETYADWAAYLNAFKNDTGIDFIIKKIDLDTLQSLINRKPNGTEFSLFLKKNKPTFYYDGLILEPQVYQAVINSYKGKILTAEDKAFIPDTVDLNSQP